MGDVIPKETYEYERICRDSKDRDCIYIHAFGRFSLPSRRPDVTIPKTTPHFGGFRVNGSAMLTYVEYC